MAQCYAAGKLTLKDSGYSLAILSSVILWLSIILHSMLGMIIGRCNALQIITLAAAYSSGR